MRNTILVFLLAIVWIALPDINASTVRSTEEQVKNLAQRYTQIEAQLDRSVHYIGKTESSGTTTTEQAWFNGAGDLIKVSVERTEPLGRELTEYSGDFFHREMFMLTRKEVRLPDGGTQVDESRDYFSNDGDLIRKLTKTAHFKTGESTDTRHVLNVGVDLPNPHDPLTQEEREKIDETFSKPEQIADALKKTGAPVFDPFKKVKGDSEKFRIIHRTVSPDGRYAIALGFAREQIDWDDFVENGEGTEESEKTYTASGEEDVRNYVVDLAQQKILGQTGCTYFSTDPGPRPGRISCQVEWSPDSTKFVQEWEQKTYGNGTVGEVTAGRKLLGVVDLEKGIDKKTLAFVKDHPAGLWMDVEQVNNDGTILIKIEVVDRSADHDFETLFSLRERLRVRETPSGLRIENVDTRRLPKEE